MWGRRLWWEMPVEESQTAMEARWYCWVTHSGWSHHHSLSLPTHTSISSWTIERLAHHMPDTLNYRAEPQLGCSFRWLMCRSTWPQSEGGGDPLCAWCAEQQIGQRGLLIASHKRLKKTSDRVITPAAEVCVPVHLAPPGSLQSKQLCHLHAQLSLGQSCHRQKNVLCLCHFSSVRLFATL